MNLISLVFGRNGNAKAKRARRGMEKDWNKFGDPAKKLMQHGDSMKKSPLWVKHKAQKNLPVKDESTTPGTSPVACD